VNPNSQQKIQNFEEVPDLGTGVSPMASGVYECRQCRIGALGAGDRRSSSSHGADHGGAEPKGRIEEQGGGSTADLAGGAVNHGGRRTRNA
jgi:hypothetical protein